MYYLVLSDDYAIPVGGIMAGGYKLFDANHVQCAARRRIRRLYVVMLILVIVSVLSLGLGRAGHLSTGGVVWLLAGSWLLTIVAAVWQVRRVRRAVWCIKVSADGIVGYDYTRRKTELSWPSINRIDIRDRTLRIVQSPYRYFDVSTSFPDFTTLSHCVEQHAHKQGVTVCVNGQPWEQVNVYELYPFLAGDPPSRDASGMTA